MEKKLIIISTAVVILALGVAGFVVSRNNATPNNMLGGDRDEHGCIGSAGYSWCEEKQKCLRMWEEKCEIATTTISSLLSESEARIIAEKSCIKGGESLAPGYYNENSKTWWFDANLNTTKPGCNPACVVSEETKTTEINWRCTGLKQ